MRRTFIVAPDGTCRIRYQTREEQFAAAIETCMRLLTDAVEQLEKAA